MVAGLIGVMVLMAIIIVVLVLLNKRRRKPVPNEPGNTTLSPLIQNISPSLPASLPPSLPLSLLSLSPAFEYTNMPPPINVGDNPMYVAADKVPASGPPSSQNTLSRQFMNPLYDYDEDEGIIMFFEFFNVIIIIIVRLTCCVCVYTHTVVTVITNPSAKP